MIRTLTCCIAVALAGGCKKSEPSTVAPVAAPARVAPEAAVPLTDATVAFFAPEQGRCEWRRADAVTGKTAVIATFDGDCFGARVTFAKDLSKAAVRFDPSLRHAAGLSLQGAPPPAFKDEDAPAATKDRVFEVTLATGAVRAVNLPPLPGPLSEVGLDASGKVTVLSVKNLTDAEVAAKKAVVDGVEVPMGEGTEGMPALAHAQREEANGGWKRSEVKPTTTGWDLALDYHALDVLREFGPSTVEMLSAHAATDEAPKSFAAALKKERPAWLTDEQDAWAVLQGAPVPLFTVMVTAEFAYTTAVLRVANGEKLEPLEGLGYVGPKLVTLRLQGPYLLVASPGSGTHPRVYDLRSRKKVFSSDTARALVFWPRPLQGAH